MPKNSACPNEMIPVKPNSRLKLMDRMPRMHTSIKTDCQANHDAGGGCTFIAPQAAQDDDRYRLQQKSIAQRGRCTEEGRSDRAAERRHRTAERKHQREDRADVDAERLHHLAVLDSGA